MGILAYVGISENLCERFPIECRGEFIRQWRALLVVRMIAVVPIIFFKTSFMSASSGHLQRRLGLASAVSITAGAVIGSGIFLKPLIIAQSLPSVGWIFFLWIALGLVCLCGAFAYAELGALFPEAGG
ncbi:partial Serine/threonine exchanger SteT, partial [uncultured bacterium]